MHKLLVWFALAPLASQVPTAAPEVARAWRAAHEAEILAEFVEFLSIPNQARDLPNIRRNVDWIRAAFARRGVAMQTLDVRYAPPAVFGAIGPDDAELTVVFYAHYDGQPTQAAQWRTGDPFAPVLLDRALSDGGQPIELPAAGERVDPQARLYARSASDDKAPIVAMLAALDALRAAGRGPRVRVKFFFEGEEEMGSAHLGRILDKHRDLLAADVWVFCDGPVHANRSQQVVFGVRGIVSVELTVYGAVRPLHSGHYGNWAPNPALRLAHLLTSMKDADGRVLVEGFYDDVAPLGEAEERALREAPDVDAALRTELGLAGTEADNARLDRRITLPSLNVHGLQSAGVGPVARNVVPATATAAIDMRLVKGMEPDRTVELLVAHIRAQGYHVLAGEPDEAVRRAHERLVRVRPTRGYRALRTPMDLPIAQRVVRAVERARGPVVRLPTLGGSLPLAVFDEVLGVPVVIVPIANHDNNQHAADENLRLQNLWDGIETMAALFDLR